MFFLFSVKKEQNLVSFKKNRWFVFSKKMGSSQPWTSQNSHALKNSQSRHRWSFI